MQLFYLLFVLVYFCCLLQHSPINRIIQSQCLCSYFLLLAIKSSYYIRLWLDAHKTQTVLICHFHLYARYHWDRKLCIFFLSAYFMIFADTLPGLQGSFLALKMVSHARLCMQNYLCIVTVGANLDCLIYNVLFDIVFPVYFTIS